MGFAVTTYPGQTPIVGLLSAQVSSSQDLLNLTLDQTTLGVNSERYNQMLVPCQVMDGKVIGFLTDITSDKNSIISLGNLSNFLTHPIYYSSEGDASTATTSLYNNVLSSVEIYSNLNFVGSAITEASTFTVGTAVSSSDGGAGIVGVETTSSVGVAFSVILKSVSGTFGIGSTIFVGVSTVGFASLSSLNYVGTGELYPDNVITVYYPDLEPTNVSVDSPYTNEQLKVLNSSTKGLGVANTFYQNSLQYSGLGTIVPSDDTISPLGIVYTFDTVSGSAVKTSIDNLISGISSDRTGISSYNSGSSTIKGYKKGFAVNVWSLENSKVIMQNDITSLQAAIQILEDPANGGPY